MAEIAMPVELDGQYRALREEAGCLRRPRAVLAVRGPDAVEYLQGQLTNDIEAVGPERGCYAALLDRKGHVQSDLRVLRLDDDGLWLDLEPGPAAGIAKHLRRYSIGRDVEIAEVTSDWVVFSVIGPRAGELTGFDRLSEEHAQASRDWEGIETLAVASDLGIDLLIRNPDADRVQERLISAGVPEVSEEAAEIVRVESGRPRFGADFGPESMPAEAGIVERAIDFEKGCYIGQEPVARLHYRGKPNRRLVGLRLSDRAKRGDELRLGDRDVGSVGTACLSPAHGPIALAIARREAGEGAEVSVGAGGTTAEVVTLPFGRFG